MLTPGIFWGEFPPPPESVNIPQKIETSIYFIITKVTPSKICGLCGIPRAQSLELTLLHLECTSNILNYVEPHSVARTNASQTWCNQLSLMKLWHSRNNGWKQGGNCHQIHRVGGVGITSDNDESMVLCIESFITSNNVISGSLWSRLRNIRPTVCTVARIILTTWRRDLYYITITRPSKYPLMCIIG